MNQRFSDTYSQGDLKVQLVYSCYLVKHGDDYLLWDTGHAMTTPNVAPKVSIVAALTSPKPREGAVAAPFAAWIRGEAKVEPVPLEKDVFGDGTVIMLNTPGHTPGHHSLMVKLSQKGAVVITGDLMHFHENYDTNGVPTFNTDRAQTLASLDRVKKIAASTKATVIIQHDARDIDKLPAFPEAAK